MSEITNEQLELITRGNMDAYMDTSKIEIATELLALRKQNAELTEQLRLANARILSLGRGTIIESGDLD